MKRLRIFVSSPGDVGEERVIAQRTLERLRAEYATRLDIEPIFWEHEPLRATATFQEQIPHPSESDIAIFILWSRMGTRLPPAMSRPDGSPYASGTEYEFEDAVNGHRQHGLPDLLVYRKSAEPLAVLDRTVVERLAQKEALDRFISKWFEGADGSFTAAFHAFSTPAQFEDLLERHLRKLIEVRLPTFAEADAAPTAPIWRQGSPFRGLLSFDAEQSPVFFGRTQAISELLDALRKQDSRGCAFVLVVGMSGVGKSSLVKAGLIPNLTRPGVIEGVGLWRRAIYRPSDAPTDLCRGLAVALTSDGGLPELRSSVADVADLAQMLRESAKSVVALIRATLNSASEQVRAAEKLPSAPKTRMALVVDQMEEVFALPQITLAERNAFGAGLDVLARSGLVWIVATLRSDFYSQCADIPELLELKAGAGQYDLRPPTAAEVSQMIRLPARMAGLRFEEDRESGERLDDVLRDTAVRNPQALPLLEFTLDELYQRRTADGCLSWAAYRQLGGLEGALGTRAEQVFSLLHPRAQTAFPAVMSALVTVGLGSEGSIARKRALLTSAAATPEAKEFVDAFVAARLLVSDRDDNNNAVVQVAHEALLRCWSRLKRWIEQNIQTLRARAHLAAEAALWQSEGQVPAFLLREGKLLSAAEDMLRERRSELTDAEVNYIEASLSAAEKRRHQHLVLAWSTAALSLAVLVGIILYLDAYIWVHVVYAKHFSERWGVDWPVGEISKKAASHRRFSYKLYRKGRYGPLLRVEAVNGYDRLTPNNGFGEYLSPSEEDTNQTVCVTTFQYDRNGQVREETGLDEYGQVVYRFTYEPHEDPSKPIYYGRYSSPKGLPMSRLPSGASYVEMTRDPQGYDVLVHYLDLNQRPSPDADGDFGSATKYDVNGRPIEEINLDADGKPWVDKEGYAILKSQYDSSGDEITQAYYDADGQTPIMAKDGYSKVRLTYDEVGNIVRRDYLDVDGQPIAIHDGFASTTYTHDSHGQRTSVQYFDVFNRPVISSWGYAGFRSAYDRLGRQVEMTNIGTDGEPVNSNDGVARRANTYNSSGRIEKEEYFDENGDRLTSDCAERRYAYDAQGREIEASCWGAEGWPFVEKGNKAFIVRYQYDESDRVNRWSYFDVDRRPAPDADGCTVRHADFDSRGKATKLECFGPDGRRVLDHRWGGAIQQNAFDAMGNPRTLAFYGVDEKPIAAASEGGCFVFEEQHDNRGAVTEFECLGLDGKLATSTISGCSRRTFRYDRAGNEIEENCFGSDGKTLMTSRKAGYARMARSYSRRGDMTEQEFFDANGRPVVPRDTGYARMTRRLGPRSELLETAYWGPDGRSMMNPEVGYARWIQRYDSQGHRVEQTTFGVEGEFVGGIKGQTGTSRKFARVTYRFDSRHNVTEEDYFGADNKPTPDDDGCEQIVANYDQRNRLILRECRDGSGHLKNQYTGAARSTMKYNQDEKQTELSFFDRDGSPVINQPEGFAREEATWNVAGKETSVAWFGAGNRPMARGGCAKVVFLYSSDNKPSGDDCLGVDGKLAYRAVVNYARRLISYDSNSELVEEAYFGTAGRPVATAYGYASVSYEYGADGHRVKETFRDAARAEVQVRVVIAGVLPDGQGAHIGLQQGDVVIQYGNSMVTYAAKLVALTASGGPEPRELRLMRDGHLISFTVKPGKLGVRLHEMTADCVATLRSTSSQGTPVPK